MEPKETHYSGPSSRIKGFETWNFSEENWKKVLDVKWICVALVEWICVALVKSVVSVKGEEILWILQRKSVWKHVGQRGKFSGRFYEESGSFKSGKTKIKSGDNKTAKLVSGSRCWRQRRR